MASLEVAAGSIRRARRSLMSPGSRTASALPAPASAAFGILHRRQASGIGPAIPVRTDPEESAARASATRGPWLTPAETGMPGTAASKARRPHARGARALRRLSQSVPAGHARGFHLPHVAAILLAEIQKALDRPLDDCQHRSCPTPQHRLGSTSPACEAERKPPAAMSRG